MPCARKILVILGHPDRDSLCGGLAGIYASAARESGAEVRELPLSGLRFDPVLHKGYKVIQALEPDLRRAQALIRWAEHLAFFYPMWWGSMPALLKGFIDRVFVPGFGFKFEHPGDYLPRQLLAGRSARLVITMDGPPLAIRLMFRDPAIHSMKGMTLEFCGVRPVHVTQLGNVKRASRARKLLWRMEMEDLGRADALRHAG